MSRDKLLGNLNCKNTGILGAGYPAIASQSILIR